MLAALTQLLIFQLIGEVIARWLDLPVPGPVIGMLLLFATLVLGDGPSHELQSTSQGILQHLSLLFVPAGTGVMVHFHRLEAEWLPIVLSLVVSTLLTLAVTALVMKAVAARRGPGAPAAPTAPAGEGA
ncbi:CidA/LrgA family protein [Oryzomicrobium sp.]|uniref:CidA/LrgA family protein n=1 Tax=Oryzomicrobium sp. TaxID=1911578 RepID=UPI0025E560FA|nr:CidA/LrgA family protein [Oryzomicrobium sp.]MCE1243929.1 CidA/LrgA family protein [Oryzomicrobium sp.]